MIMQTKFVFELLLLARKRSIIWIARIVIMNIKSTTNAYLKIDIVVRVKYISTFVNAVFFIARNDILNLYQNSKINIMKANKKNILHEIAVWLYRELVETRRNGDIAGGGGRYFFPDVIIQ